MYAILYWEDSTFSVVALSGILSPRKEVNEYAIGDVVQAKFQGKVYSAKIYEIGENRASLNKSLSVGFKIDLTRIAPSACIQPMHPRLTPEDAAKEDKTDGPTKRKRHRSVPSKAQEDVANKDEPTKKRHRSDMNVGQSSDPLVEQARQMLLMRRQTTLPVAPPPATLPIAPPPATLPVAPPPATLPVAPPPATLPVAPPPATLPVALPPATLEVAPPPATLPNAPPRAILAPEALMLPAVTLVPETPPVVPAILAPSHANPAQVTWAPQETTYMGLEYGPPPPTARPISFLEMMEEPFINDEITQQSFGGPVSCHSCCQLMEQLQTRVAQLENEIQRRANSPPSKSPMCATPSRRPVVASTPAREPLGNITVGNNSMLQML
ncbi:uncharacterized protein LOC127864621 [Dreissena polymorpha]|uniref:uncharacterized protein LOC127864621 n=1 Tax=Dreissena polymorpha TaxID=45954 RepID=UPI00226569F2|nr:uncharacterized protein LOC127864621 [Dreissena polymorpha]